MQYKQPKATSSVTLILAFLALLTGIATFTVLGIYFHNSHQDVAGALMLNRMERVKFSGADVAIIAVPEEPQSADKEPKGTMAFTFEKTSSSI